MKVSWKWTEFLLEALGSYELNRSSTEVLSATPGSNLHDLCTHGIVSSTCMDHLMYMYTAVISKPSNMPVSISTWVTPSLVPRPSSRAVDPLPEKVTLFFQGAGPGEEGLGTRLGERDTCNMLVHALQYACTMHCNMHVQCTATCMYNALQHACTMHCNMHVQCTATCMYNALQHACTMHDIGATPLCHTFHSEF